jgi:hypothetical protein
MSEAPETSANTKNLSKTNTSTLLTLDHYLKGIMKLHHQSIDQANINPCTILENLKSERELCQANMEHIAKLVESVF